MILIHQAIYGELDSSKGYHLLASSFTKNDFDTPKRLSNVTDLLDRPPNSVLSSPVLRGFGEGDYYLLIKTFPDNSPEVRVGRVFSHVLIVNKSDLSKINNLSELVEYHIDELDKHAALEPINFESSNKAGFDKIYSDRIAAAINGIVNHNNYNNTVVWVGEDGYLNWIDSFYKNLPLRVKQSLKIGVAFSPQRINSENLNVVYIPIEIKSNWQKMLFKLVAIDDKEKLESQTAYLLSGNKEVAKDLYNLIDDYSIIIEEVDDLIQLEKVIETYLRIGKDDIQLKDLLIFSDLVSNFSPKQNVAKENKKLLLEQITSSLSKANATEISFLPNINWNGFSSYKEVLTKALNNWLKANLFLKDLASNNVIVVKKGFIYDKRNWWNEAVRKFVEEQLSKWDKEYSISIWEWFIAEPVIIDSFKTLLPNESETEILKNIPKIRAGLGEDLLDLAEYKEWYKLYAFLCCKLYPPKEAINHYLQLDKNAAQIKGLEVISNLVPAYNLIEYSISNPSNELIEVVVKLIKNKPSLVSKIDVSKQGWINIWEACEVKGISIYNNVKSPLKLTYELLSEYLRGKDISDNLLKKVSESSYNNLSDFQEREKLWPSINNPAKANFVNATSTITKFQKYLLSNELAQFEENFNGKNEEEEYLIKVISNKRDYSDSGLILGFFEEFSFREKTFLLFLFERHAAFDKLQSRRIGNLIKKRDWKESYLEIKNKYALNNSSLKIAVELNYSTFSFKSFFSWGSGINKNIKTMSSESMDEETQKKILIVVATKLEAKMVLTRMQEKGCNPQSETKNNMVFWHLGVVNGSALIMQKTTTMGSSGAGGSTLSISNAINAVKPDAVIMLGIAFGLNQNKQKIGTVLVSKQIEGYELSKIKENAIIQRADKIPASKLLVNIFENAEFNFNQFDLNFGLMLSGDKLVDNEEFVKRLKNSYPEAIGGEMEGEGLQSACHDKGVDWILLKGICDWGYDKNTPSKEADQKLAISNVCDFFIHALSNFKF